MSIARRAFGGPRRHPLGTRHHPLCPPLFFLGEGEDDRKLRIDYRLKELAGIFSIAVGGFSVLDNHLNLLVLLDPDVAAAWSDEEVVRCWGRLFLPCDNSRKPLPASNLRETAAIFERIGTTAETWQARLN